MGEPVSVGKVIAGKYRVERVLGTGGMGMVVAATHLQLQKMRAIKLMLPALAANPMALERFLREARAASELKSEHVAQVFDVGTLESGAPFMVMEYLDGSDLASVISARTRLPEPEAALYVLHACEALAEAHACGIVHRDLKPANLFLTRGNDGTPKIKVLDFGISKLLKQSGEESKGLKTNTGAVLGSPLYMSPEQIRAQHQVDGRTDIWAIGVILYELVTGGPPFDGDEALQVLAKILECSPLPPSKVTAGLPPELDRVILRCLEKDMASRYPDVAALARDLLPFAPSSAAPLVERIGRIVASSGGGAVPVPPPDDGGVDSEVDALASTDEPAVPPRPTPVCPDPAPPADPSVSAVPPSKTITGVVSADPARHLSSASDRRPMRAFLIIAGGVLILGGSAAGLSLSSRWREGHRETPAVPSAPAAPSALDAGMPFAPDSSASPLANPMPSASGKPVEPPPRPGSAPHPEPSRKSPRVPIGNPRPSSDPLPLPDLPRKP